MRYLKIVAMVIVALLVPLTASANHYADFYVIPVASHTPGLNGTNWMRDIAIQNFQTGPLIVQLVLIQSGEGNSDNISPLLAGTVDGSVTVPPGGSVLLKDVVNVSGITRQTGSILVGGDRPFAVTSRSYSMSPSGDTVGQTVLPVRDFIDNSVGQSDPAMAVAYIPGLISNAQSRTNLGFVAGNANSSGDGLRIEVSLKDAAGTLLGTPRVFFVGPGTFTHVQFSSRTVADSSFDIGSATFRILSGSGAVAPYASVIDNRTADAVFVAGQFPPNAVRPNAAPPSVFRSLFDSRKLSR